MFQALTPEFILDTLAAQGFKPSGQIYLLNSYENRVYEVLMENTRPVVVKFYRPGRWSKENLIDEHKVLQALETAEVPVVRPLVLNYPHGFETLGFANPYFFAVYPKFGGHEEPDLNDDHRQWLGRTLARLHNVTCALHIKNRLPLNTQTYGDEQLAKILSQNYIPDDLRFNLEDIILQCLDLIDPILNHHWQPFAVHGDCHLGNVLWNPDGPTLVDFDDMVIAPAVQDMWMLFHGDEDEQKKQKEAFFSGYNLFRKFDGNELILVESLRTLRMIRYAAWVGERYNEEIFKRTFPYYPERKYWEEFLLSMKEQLSAVQEM